MKGLQIISESIAYENICLLMVSGIIGLIALLLVYGIVTCIKDGTKRLSYQNMHIITATIFSILFTAFAVFSSITAFKPTIHYTAKIDKSCSFLELTNKYTIIEQKGELFILKEKK